ncbi:MAG: 4Fe-4S ferredoxin, partial [Candidatus Omnitrophica bacterium CG12_big_fil_rev_8_21_14_0_65_50_5]
LDPGGILNPGVILNSDKGVHLKNLKPMPAADPLVDQCTECGFCEPVCPSRNLTFTPRQRIAALRALKMMEREHDPRRRSFARKFAYAVEATCAADGLCALVCPVSIDTGRAVKALRAARHAPWIRSGMRHLSGQHAAFLALPRAGLRLASALSGILGAAKTEQVLHALRRFSGDLIPAWHSLLRAAPADIPFPALTRQDPSPWSAVYFSGCPSRVFAPAGGSQGSLMAGVHSLLNKAGCEVKLPEKAAGLCCGLVYESRGFSEAA